MGGYERGKSQRRDRNESRSQKYDYDDYRRERSRSRAGGYDRSDRRREASKHKDHDYDRKHYRDDDYDEREVRAHHRTRSRDPYKEDRKRDYEVDGDRKRYRDKSRDRYYRDRSSDSKYYRSEYQDYKPYDKPYEKPPVRVPRQQEPYENPATTSPQDSYGGAQQPPPNGLRQDVLLGDRAALPSIYKGPYSDQDISGNGRREFDDKAGIMPSIFKGGYDEYENVKPPKTENIYEKDYDKQQSYTAEEDDLYDKDYRRPKQGRGYPDRGGYPDSRYMDNRYQEPRDYREPYGASRTHPSIPSGVSVPFQEYTYDAYGDRYPLNSQNRPLYKQYSESDYQLYKMINKRLTEAQTVSEIYEVWMDSDKNFNEVNLSTTIHRLAKVKERLQLNSSEIVDQPAFLEMLLIAKSKVKNMRQQEIANFVWGLGKLNYAKDQAILQQLQQQAIEHIITFTPQGVANTLWGFAELNFQPDATLLNDMVDFISEKIESYTCQAVAEILWAFAMIGYTPKQKMLKLAVTQIQSQKEQIRVNDLVQLLWSLTQFNFNPGPQLLQIAVQIALEKLGVMKDNFISTLLWVFGFFSFNPGPPLLVSIATYYLENYQSFSVPAATKLLYGYANLNFHPGDPVLRTLAMFFIEKYMQVQATNISKILEAFSTFSFNPGQQLLSNFISNINQNLSNLDASSLILLLWCYALFLSTQGIQLATWNHWVEALAKKDLEEIPDDLFVKLHEAFLAVNAQTWQQMPSMPPRFVLSQQLVKPCTVAWQSYVSQVQMKPLGVLHQDVERILSIMNIQFDVRPQLLGGKLMADFILLPQGKIVIQCNVPEYFTDTLENHPPQLVGDITMRVRLFELYGFFPIQIDFFKWIQLDLDPMKVDLLRSMIMPIVQQINMGGMPPIGMPPNQGMMGPGPPGPGPQGHPPPGPPPPGPPMTMGPRTLPF